jgi:ribulose-5-phosphate 4-epimerase/fuculose-1-phosphate aldolase
MLMLRNHGILTAGSSVPECFTYLYFLMKACEIQVKTPTPYCLPSQEAIETTREQSQSLGKASALTWPALTRLLDSRNPGYAV